MKYELKFGDCLSVMEGIPSGSIDMVLKRKSNRRTSCPKQEITKVR